MIENNREAAKLMAKLSGIEHEINAENLVRTQYRRMLREAIQQWNNTIGNDYYKLTLDHIVHSQPQDGSYVAQYILKGRGINLAYRIRTQVEYSENYTDQDKDRADEEAHRRLFFSLMNAGINALNPEVYTGNSILPQEFTYERKEINLTKS